MVKVYIDAGHGGADSGAIGNGLKEKDLTLKIAMGIVNGLAKYKGILIKTTRTNDTFLTLKQRTDIANKWKADLFVSIHINSASGNNGTGFESFIDPPLKDNSQTSKRRSILHKEIMKQVPNVIDRGMKKANLHVLRESNMDAVLTECLFINNSIDSLKLKDKKVIDKFIDGHVNGIVKIFGLKLKPEFEKETVKPSKPSKPQQPDNQEKVIYRVICGSFKEKDNSIKVNKELFRLGIDSYIMRVKGLYRVVAGTYHSKIYASKQVTKLRKMGFQVFLDIE